MTEDWGIWLKEQMDELCWSQETLAAIAKVARSSIGNWLKGYRLPLPEYKEHIEQVIEEAQDTSQWIKNKMQELRWTQSDLARAVGVDRSAVGYWVRGIWSPSKDNLRRIGRVFAKALREQRGRKPKEVDRVGNVIFPPNHSLTYTSCKECADKRECWYRVNREGLPMMCEGLTEDDLRVAEQRGKLKEIVWWKQ